MKGIHFVISLFSLLCLLATATAQERKIVQLSGIISHTDSEMAVPYVTIRNISFKGQTFSANYQGYFSFVAHEGDTITFSSVGYFPTQLVIPKTEGDKYTAMVTMQSQVTEIEAVMPYPWASIEEFNIAFMALNLAEDDIQSAKRNLSPEALAALSRVTPMSANEIYNFSTTQNHIGLTNQNINQRMANPLLSPFAWGNLIRQISEGNKSRAKNNW